MRDKRMTADEVVSQIKDGMTVGIGGWGSRRKPMALVKAILRSTVEDLTVVTYGGPDAGLLCAAGKVRKLVYGFVSLDTRGSSGRARPARSRCWSSTRACSRRGCAPPVTGCRSCRSGQDSVPTC
jgi:acyl CoA:acetate/3-ketoacid CoA transferase alpha subunit